MRILKNTICCLVLGLILGGSLIFSFSACGKKEEVVVPEEEPEPEVFVTQEIEYEDYQALVDEYEHNLDGTYVADIVTDYGDGRNETAKLIFSIQESEISSSLEVTGSDNFKAYRNSEYMYYTDSEQKVFSRHEDYPKHQEYNTYKAYKYMNNVFTPTGREKYKIYDGSLLSEIKQAYLDSNRYKNQELSVVKTASQYHTNISLTITINTTQVITYTVKYTGTTLTEVDIDSNDGTIKRSISIKCYDGTIEFPDFEDYIMESNGDEFDDNWRPSD